MGCNHKHFYLVHTVSLKRGDSFLGPCFSGGPCQPSGLSKYHHTSAWSDSNHLPWLCLSHPLPARARTPWLFRGNLPPFLHVSAAKKDKWPPRLCSSIYGDRCRWLTPMPCWSFTILNINIFFCWFTELQSYCLGIISVGVLGTGEEKQTEPEWWSPPASPRWGTEKPLLLRTPALKDVREMEAQPAI